MLSLSEEGDGESYSFLLFVVDLVLHHVGLLVVLLSCLFGWELEDGMAVVRRLLWRLSGDMPDHLCICLCFLFILLHLGLWEMRLKVSFS